MAQTVSPIESLLSQTWPANRLKGDFRTEMREAQDSQHRRVVCGHCGKESPLLDGPTGRAWWASHACDA